MLKIQDLHVFYGDIQALWGVSFEVRDREIVTLVGSNGAGKTTTFRMVIGLIRPDAGRIVFNGHEVTRTPIYRRARLGMGFLPQERSVFQRLSVVENLLAILETTEVPRRERKPKAMGLLGEYGLEHLSKQKAFTLSGGETRRLEICRSLLTSPSILLLDEPFGGVDPIAVNELQGIIRKLRGLGIGVLLTDHNVRETLAITDRSNIIDEGRVRRSGHPEEIIADPQVRERYLGSNFKM
jgi:lipopolysaccharide export system ATP-binding protein